MERGEGAVENRCTGKSQIAGCQNVVRSYVKKFKGQSQCVICHWYEIELGRWNTVPQTSGLNTTLDFQQRGGSMYDFKNKILISKNGT